MKKNLKSFAASVVFTFVLLQILPAATTEWAKSYGGLGDDQPYATAIDANGNIFVLTKYLEQCDFDPNVNKTANVKPTSLMASVAVSKYDANGNFLWVKSFSVNAANGGTVFASTMVLDKAGNVYFAGNFSGTTDFNPDPVAVANLTPSPVTLSNPDYASGNQDAFVCKLDNNGNFVWVKQFLGDLNQDVLEISVDESNNLYLSITAAGYYDIKTDFDPDPTTTSILTNTSNESVFIVKLNSDGNYMWAKQLQGTGDRYCYGIKTDKDGNLYLGGHFKARIYPDPTNKTTFLTTSDNDPVFGTTDLFFIKWDASGNYVWSKSFGGTSYDVFGSLEIDPVSSSIYISGEFLGTIDFNMNPSNQKKLTSFGYNTDGFLAKYDADGNCVWAKQFGGAGQDKVQLISIDALGNLFIGGQFAKTANFDAGVSNVSLTSAGNGDAFIAKLDNQGNFNWVKQIGGLSWDWTGGLAATGDGNVFATGVFAFDASISGSNTTLTAIDAYDVWMYKTNISTALNETKLDATISIYPNPTQGQTVIKLNKEFSNLKVTVRNLLGAEISINNYHNVSKINLNLQGESGLYLVDLKDENGRLQTMKVVKR